MREAGRAKTKSSNPIKWGDYASAVTSLKQAALSVNLTPEQKQSLQDLLAPLSGDTTLATLGSEQGDGLLIPEFGENQE